MRDNRSRPHEAGQRPCPQARQSNAAPGSPWTQGATVCNPEPWRRGYRCFRVSYGRTLVGLVFTLREPLRRLLESIRARVEAGGEVELAGPAGLKRGSRNSPSSSQARPPAARPAWTSQRATLHEVSRDVFLAAHVLSPSKVEGQKFEINTFLVGHRRAKRGYPEDLSDVVRAEIYLGGGWGRRVFDIPRVPGRDIGLQTHAYGPVVCLCRIHFDDGHTAVINRYLDFESATARVSP